MMSAAGFADFAIVSRVDVYAGAPQHSSAAKFGTLGITFRARRLRAGEVPVVAACELPVRSE